MKLLMNLNRCIACKACEIACEKEHNGISFITVIETDNTALPVTCRHCEKAPCLENCPTKAIYKDQNGTILINQNKCIGCYMCYIVCPYGIPVIDIKQSVAFKCDLCQKRLKQGLEPICVAICPTNTLIFDDPIKVANTKKQEAIKNLIIGAKNEIRFSM